MVNLQSPPILFKTFKLISIYLKYKVLKMRYIKRHRQETIKMIQIGKERRLCSQVSHVSNACNIYAWTIPKSRSYNSIYVSHVDGRNQGFNLLLTNIYIRKGSFIYLFIERQVRFSVKERVKERDLIH